MNPHEVQDSQGQKVADLRIVIDLRTEAGKLWSAQHPNTIVFVDDYLVKLVWYVDMDPLTKEGFVYTYDVLNDNCVHTDREGLPVEPDWLMEVEDGHGIYHKIVSGRIDLHQSRLTV